MTPSDLTKLLATSFRSKLKVLIKGAPGIGKTDIVVAAAKSAEADLVFMHPAVSDPTDFKGLPTVVDSHAEFLPYGQLRKLVTATGLTVCFIDDIGQAPHAVQAALMQLLQSREIDGQRISDDVVFCGATNDTSHMAGVQNLLEPVKSRWHTIVELTPDLPQWIRWASKHDVPEPVLAFVMFRGEKALHDFKPTRELTNSPSPRTVANAGALVRAGIVRHDILAGACGDGWAAEFCAFLKVYQGLPDPDDCIANPTTARVPDENDLTTIYAIAVAVSLRATKKNMDGVTKYLNRLPKEHEVLAIRDATRRDAELFNTAAYTNWSIKNIAVLA